MTRYLSLDDIRTHAYVIGATRSGKTNLLLRLMHLLSDSRRQASFPSSVIFIDPHGDAALNLAEMIDDWSKLLLFDPEYTAFAFNPLELYPKPSNNGERALLIQNQVSELVTILVDVMKTDPSQTPRMQWIYRGALYYLYAYCDDPTFLDLYYLMSDMVRLDREDMAALFRRADVAEEITNRTIEAIATLDRSAFTGVLNRIFNFVMPSESLTTRTFCTRRSTLPFDKMLEPGYTTVFRLSRSNLPNDFREIITNTLVLKVHFLIQQRARQLEAKGMDPSARTPVFMFIDEFQVVERLSAVESMLSEGAKFGLSLVLAHQNLSQIRPELQSSILSNVRTVVCFRTGPDDASKLSRLFGEELSGGMSTKEVLVKLPRYMMVIRRGTSKSFSKPEIWNVSKVREPVHTQKEVIEFMKNNMEVQYGGAQPVREPVYEAEMERMLKDRGVPQVNPLNWRLITHLYYSEGRGFERSTDHYIKTHFMKSYGWGSSLIDNALDKLQALGYVTRKPVTGMIYSGKNEFGTPIWRLPRPGNRDELTRSRTWEFDLTGTAKKKFFSRPEIKSQRAGGPLHRKVMDHFIEEYREKGYWVEADYGERHEQMPDLMVFWPKLKNDDRAGYARESWDPYEWEGNRAWAIEVETSPGKNQEQVRKNYKKCVKRNFDRIVFAITTEEHRALIQKALKDENPSSYSIQLVDVGMSMDDLKRMLKEEEEEAVSKEGEAKEVLDKAPQLQGAEVCEERDDGAQETMFGEPQTSQNQEVGEEEAAEPATKAVADGIDEVTMYEILCNLDPNSSTAKSEVMKKYGKISGRQMSRYLSALVERGFLRFEKRKYSFTDAGRRIVEEVKAPEPGG